MRKILILLAAIIVLPMQPAAQDYQGTPHGITATVNQTMIGITFYSPTIVRVSKYPKGEIPAGESFSVIKEPQHVDLKITQSNNVVSLASDHVVVFVNLYTGDVLFNRADNYPLIAEKSGSTRFLEKSPAEGKKYEVGQTFMLDKQEAIYGLGQHQQGNMDQRGREVFLQQANTEIAVPIIHSVKGYAIFWDNASRTLYRDSSDGLSFTSSGGDGVDYYFIYGGNADGVIAGIRDLTGQTPMFPLWAFGFWQSRERYTSQQELTKVVKKYRDLRVPLDVIVQDWQYWNTDNKKWNAVEFGNPAFPDPEKMIGDVHQMHAHFAISVWPSFGPETKIYKDLKSKSLLFDFETYPPKNGVKVYDAFHPEAREIYWNHMNSNLFSLGVDCWWLDATEPENLNDDSRSNQVTFRGRLSDVGNAFPLVSVGGIYDHQRSETSAKRACILTRSAFAGQQRYGAASWSGDIDSRWNVLRKQISAGLNFSLCGIPYWNTDIGGFWAGRAYPNGVNDLAYQELYVRWMQFAAFTPLMRSHGTNTPREIWQFGRKGDWAYDAQEKYIRLRYRLLPYIYSIAYDVTFNSGTMMRALSMDFAFDDKVHDIDNQFMFGPSLLVAPVTDSMYVHRSEGKPFSRFDQVKTQRVYLPEGNDWYDFWTSEKVKGGLFVNKAAPVDIIPLYIKAGSVIPVGPEAQYAEEKPWNDLSLFVFPGKDAEFSLYEDENDNYNYEKGNFSVIKIKWDDKNRVLTIEDRQGQYPGMLKERSFHVSIVENNKTIWPLTGKPDQIVRYNGNEIRIKL